MSEESAAPQTVAEVTSESKPEVTEEKDFAVAEDSAPERPEWLPEKYKTPQELVDGYTSLQQKFHQKETDMKEAWEKELHEEAFKDRPATSGDYTLPEVIDQNLAPDNKLLNWITDSGVAALISDNLAVEKLGMKIPKSYKGPNLPLHDHCLFKLGIHLGELWYLQELAQWLRQNNRNRFK